MGWLLLAPVALALLFLAGVCRLGGEADDRAERDAQHRGLR